MTPTPADLEWFPTAEDIDQQERRDLAEASGPEPELPATLPAERSADTIYCHQFRAHQIAFHRQLPTGWTCTACGPRPGDL